MGNSCIPSASSISPGLPLGDANEMYLIYCAVHFCFESYQGTEDTVPKHLHGLGNRFPEYNSILGFRSFEPGNNYGIGNNRAIVFNIKLPHVNSIGLDNDSTGTDSENGPQMVTVIAIRGTKTSTEVLQDVASVMPETATCKQDLVCKGFSDAYTALCSSNIVDYIKLMSDESQGRFLIVGHSLGGAVGLLLAIDLRDMFPASSIALLTFGQPRVLSADFADKLDPQFVNYYKRMINAKDPVTLMPVIGFKHVGSPCVYQDSSGGRWDAFPSVPESDGDPRIRRCFPQMRGSRHRLPGSKGYVARVEAGLRRVRLRAQAAVKKNAVALPDLMLMGS